MSQAELGKIAKVLKELKSDKEEKVASKKYLESLYRLEIE